MEFANNREWNSRFIEEKGGKRERGGGGEDLILAGG